MAPPRDLYVVLAIALVFMVTAFWRPACIETQRTCRHVRSCQGACAAVLDRIEHERKSSSWNSYYPTIVQFLKKRGITNGTFVEIGTAYGGLAEHVLTNMPEINYVAVDPFLAGYDEADAMSKSLSNIAAQFKASASDLSRFWARAISFGFRRFECRFELIHDFSDGAAVRFEPSSVHVLFIDGLHSEEGVMNDFENWRSTVAKGYPIIFNDYNPHNWPTVYQAVNKIAKMLGQTPMIIDINNAALIA